MSDGQKKGNTMLVRTVVGAIYFVVVVSCLYAGVRVTAVVCALMATMCAYELLRMLHNSGRQPNDIIALGAAALFPLAPLVSRFEIPVLALMAILVSCAVWYVAMPRVTINDVAMTVFVAVYTGFGFSTVTMIRACDPDIQGFLLAFGVLGSIWLDDAMAYFVGSRFGKRKLAPRISPNKSVEGFWGGMGGCMLIWLVVWFLKVRSIKLYLVLFCGVAVGGMAVLGDLFESRIKRGFGVKDSGDLLPGHGGMLDRSDALIFGVMTAFLILRIGGVV